MNIRPYSINLNGEIELESTIELARSGSSERLSLARDEAISDGEWTEGAECVEYGWLVTVGRAVEIKVTGNQSLGRDFALSRIRANSVLSDHETLIASLSQSLAEASEKIAALEKERDELRERITSAVNTLRDTDEEEMHEQTWASVVLAIGALEGR